MLDHYFSNHSLKESSCHCHADNCVGQKGNRLILGYFAWRVITGKRRHTRCLVHGHFGLIKKMYRHLNCDTVHYYSSVA